MPESKKPENKIPDQYKDEPHVTLGGVEWAVPPLSARRIIRFGALATSITQISATMPESEMMKIYEAIFNGIVGGTDPVLKFEQWLDDYPIHFKEIIAALPTISKQAGMEFGEAKPGEVKAEATNGVDRSSTTGTIL